MEEGCGTTGRKAGDEHHEHDLRRKGRQTMASQDDQETSDQYGNPANQAAPQDSAGGISGQAEDRIDQLIDQVAGKVPGGSAVAQKAKDAVPGALDSLEKAAEGRMGGLLGNLHE